MKVSMLAKSAAVALVFGLIASTPAHAVDLTGSGASFPALLVEACKAPFATASGHSFTYASLGSGTGRSNSDKSVGDFWFSDAAHTAASKRSSIIHAPVVAAPIGILHNLPSRNTLSLSATTIAGIFSGTITRWDDPKIKADNNRAVKEVIYKVDNNGVTVKDKAGKPIVLREVTRNIRYTLPPKPIKVIYRSDSSGTSGAFTAALRGAAPEVWTKAGNNVFTSSFPGVITDKANLGRLSGYSGSAAVAAAAAKTQYSVTYAESSYAKDNGLAIANIKNEAGNWQAPTSGGVSAFLGAATVSAKGIVTFDYKTKDPGSYLFGTTSYALVDTKQKDADTAKAVRDLLSYLLDPKCPATDPKQEFTTITGALRDVNLKLIAQIGN